MAIRSGVGDLAPQTIVNEQVEGSQTSIACKGQQGPAHCVNCAVALFSYPLCQAK